MYETKNFSHRSRLFRAYRSASTHNTLQMLNYERIHPSVFYPSLNGESFTNCDRLPPSARHAITPLIQRNVTRIDITSEFSEHAGEAIKSERKWRAASRDASEINRIVVRNYGECRQSTQRFLSVSLNARSYPVLCSVMELSRPFDPL